METGEQRERRRRRQRDQEVRREIQIRIWQAERAIDAESKRTGSFHCTSLWFLWHLQALRRQRRVTVLADHLVMLDLLELWEQTMERKLEWTDAA